MSFRRLAAAALALGIALAMGACSNTVADMWPHWAGGEPAGLPPRPGQPGYEEFIAHGQPNENAAVAPAAPVAPAGTTAAIVQQKSAAQSPPLAQPRPQENSEVEPVSEPLEHPVSDKGDVRGGLY
jgi:hypothetical protein